MSAACPTCRRPAARRSAFSLIEVNMALLVVSLGLAALLGLFPVALRESGLATADTAQALFATRLLNAIQANANTVTTWAEWRNPDVGVFVQGIMIDGAALKADNSKQIIENAHGVEGSVLCYRAELGFVADTGERLRYAAVRVTNNKHSDIGNSTVYYTEFRFGSN